MLPLPNWASGAWYPRGESNAHQTISKTAASARWTTRTGGAGCVSSRPPRPSCKNGASAALPSRSMVPPGGHDPPTFRVRAGCSAHLSYDGVVGATDRPRSCTLPLKRRLLCPLELPWHRFAHAKHIGIVGAIRTLTASRPPRFELGVSAVPPRRHGLVGRARLELALLV